MTASLLNEEQVLLRQSLRDLSLDFRTRAAAVDRDRAPPIANIEKLARLGLTGSFIPPKYGGPGKTTLETALIFEQVAGGCANTALLLTCTDGGAARAILHLGSEDQKHRYLPKFLSGELLAAWAISEADAGSDAGACKTLALESGDEYVLNGAKAWINGAQVSGLFLIVVRLSEAPGLLGCGAILVERDTPGFTIGRHTELTGLRATGMAELFLNNCRVPKQNLLVRCGEMDKLIAVLDAERLVGNPSICLGIAGAALEEAIDFVRQRSQFGKTISEYQGIQWKIADLAIDIEAARALIYRAAERTDCSSLKDWDASITKVFANEMSLRVTNAAVQMAGASGLAVEYPFERHLRDVRGLSISHGTTEMHRSAIAHEVILGSYTV